MVLFKRVYPEALCPQSRITELSSAAYAGWWTLLLSLPAHLFHTNAAFLGLSHMAGAAAWAAATGTVAILQLVGWGWGNLPLRWLGSFLATLLWTFISAGIYLASPFWRHIPVNTGFGVYGITAVIDLYVAVMVLPPFLYAAHESAAVRRQMRAVVRDV